MSESFITEDENQSAYDILEVDYNCTTEELKASYKRLILTHHPDKKGIANNFQRIQTAWKFLSTPEERKKYDMASNNGIFGASESFCINDFTESNSSGIFVRSCRCGDCYEVHSVSLVSIIVLI